ncbi:dihydrodipicolinate synthase family protein (plasmid) [Shimia sp. W99]
MAGYIKTEARAWTRDKLKGAVNCTIPSFTNDLEGLNEAAIRHDVALAKKHGFVGSLAVGEVNITAAEYTEFVRIMKDEAGPDFYVFHHASSSTLAQNIAAAQTAEAAGADYILLSYPATFYPESEDDIFEYTKAFCDATNLGVLLFPMAIWGFSRIHPADISTGLIRRLLDACPNIASIKAEGGHPSIMSVIECHREFGEEVVISMPLEWDLLPLGQLIPIQLSATSDHEFWGPLIPQVMKLLAEGKHDQVTEIYWRMHPARKIKNGLTQQMTGSFLLNRMQWKFQGWLQGYNGGPLRGPTPRLHANHMTTLVNAQKASGLNPSDDPFREFFVGRIKG